MSGRDSFLKKVDVSRETLERLEIYAALLRKWNPSINLVSKTTLPDLWTRHMADSAQVFDLGKEDAGFWVDLGTGGGFPGLVVAILAVERRPELETTCVESDLRKATFLRTVVRETGLRTKVLPARIEELSPLQASILSARALAPLPQLLSFAERHLAPHGEAIFLKGTEHEAEIAESLETWSFRVNTYPSKTNPGAAVLKIGDIERV